MAHSLAHTSVHSEKGGIYGLHCWRSIERRWLKYPRCVKLTKDGIGQADITFNVSFLGSDCDLYHVSSYQLRGSPFLAFPVTGSLVLATLVRGLLPWAHTILPSFTADFQVSMVWNNMVSLVLIHWTGTLTSCFSQPEISPSVPSPLMPSAPMASTASLTSFQGRQSLCSFSSAIFCQIRTFYSLL